MEHKLYFKLMPETHSSPPQASYGMSIVCILKKIGCFATKLQYIESGHMVFFIDFQ